jgi:hypothetical protein
MPAQTQEIPVPTLPITRKDYSFEDGEMIYYPKVEGAFCPIDGNPLFSIEGFDGDKYQHYRWDCLACGAFYTVGDRNPESLRKQAIWYLNKVVQPDLRALQEKVAPLEAIMKSAREKGLVKSAQ